MNAKHDNLVNPGTNIVLIGMMGAGKSTLGGILAEKTGFTFVDLDTKIEQEAGSSIAEIISGKGENAFRELESEQLRAVSGKQLVLACGGGTPCHGDNMKYLQELGAVIYLEAAPTVLAGRLMGKLVNRPLLRGIQSRQQLEAHLVKLLEARQACYRRARYVIQSDKPVGSVANEILNILA